MTFAEPLVTTSPEDVRVSSGPVDGNTPSAEVTGEGTEALGVDPRQVKQRPTWDKASDEQILDDVRALAATGRTIVIGGAVKDLLVARGLWPDVVKLLQGSGPPS